MKIQFSFHKNIPTKALYVDLMCPKCITTHQKCYLLFKLRKCAKLVGTFSGIFSNIRKSFGKIAGNLRKSPGRFWQKSHAFDSEKVGRYSIYTLKMTSLWYNLFFLALNLCVWFSKKLQQKWTSKTVNLIEGNKLQTFFKVYIFNHHGNKVKIFNDLQNNLLVTHGSSWVLNISTSCLWFRRVKTSWKTVVDLSRGNHTKCPKFQTLAQKNSYCKFYPGYLVTRTGDREICAVTGVSIRVTNG